MPDMLSIGEVANLNGQFTDQDGDAANPAVVTLTITAPDGTVITRTMGTGLANPEVGLFTYDLSLTQGGVWTYAFVGAGGGVDTGPQSGFLIVGAPTTSGPCSPWITPQSIFDCGPCSSVARDDWNMGVATLMARAATEFYWQHSGRQFSGLCQQTIRPCCNPTCRTARCGCADPPTIRLPRSVRGIVEVRVDGDALDPAVYHIEEERFLVRTDRLPWPSCQDMLADPQTDPNTFQITYVYGTEPPALGLVAASELACELYRGCTGGDCSVPQRVTNIARQGMTMQLIRPEELGIDPNGNVKTGLRVGQLFLATYPGNKGRARPGVASPDVRPAARRTS